MESLLGGEDLIRVLNESVSVSEYVAEKLSAINEVNEQLEVARTKYSAVAARASTLYFVLQGLQKINPMYSFSLTWFKEMFQKAIDLTNVVRPDIDRLRRQDDATLRKAQVGKDSGQLTRQDRIDLLIVTITQEVFKRVQYAIYEEDRVLIEYLVAIEILQKEHCVEPALFDFVISGPRHVAIDTSLPWTQQKLPWMTTLMWADLKELSNIKPFNKDNLLQHIAQNAGLWSNFRNEQFRQLTFSDLPNSGLLDFKFF